MAGAMQAQGTKLWSVDRYDAMERGTADGVAIRSDGRLEAGPAKSQVYDSGKSYAWSLASDRSGNAYLGLGGSTAGSGVVMRVAADGKAEKILETKELAVQALAVAPDGSVLAATSPDGKVYRVPAGAASGTVIFDPATTEEKPKYLWGLATGKNGDVYVAAGAPAAVYRVPANGGKAEVLLKTTDQHIRCLLMAPDGTLWAGSDGAGVIYRIDTKVAGAKPFAAYAASRREITSLAMDESGNVYAAGVGAKGSVPLPPLPVTGNVGITVTFAQPGSSSAAGSNTLIPEGSEIYRIAKDGTPLRLLSMKDDVVYALIFRNGALLAATGNRGRIYRVDIATPGQFTDVSHLDAAQGMAFAVTRDSLLVATSNSGKLFRLSDAAAKESTYTSEVLDTQVFSKWGRVETRAEGDPQSYELWVRSGNVPSPLMGWSEWTRIGSDGAVTAPPGRYAQWKAVFHSGAAAGIDAVGLNYLPRNVAPMVDEIVVQPGARIAQGSGAPQNTTVQVAFPQPAGATPVMSFQPDANVAPLTAQKDKNSVTARWLAHDDNGDELIFAVWYRGVGEKNWRLLKDKISERFYSFDSSLLPDGGYELKVVASDAPVHTDSEALQGERVSPVFVVDTTPPVPGALTATLVPGSAGSKQKIHATLEASDATSPIAHAEYSIDAGPWQYLEPVGQVSDSRTERYDFTAEIPQTTTPVADAKEHVIAVRVYDRYENMAAVKAVVR
ncbi:WD40 repeat domain-containing protein [Edaphobacter sp. 4G125]|nr:WD40 repeat domain-containing protein [Edaphobacter sp. 4G125]